MLRYARDKYMVNLNLTDHVDIYLVASQPFSMNTTVIIALENDTATLQYVNVTFVTGSYVSTGVNVKMLIEQNDEKITYSASEQLRVTFEVPPGYTNLSKAYPQEAVIVRQSTMINISGSTELIPSSMAMSNSLTLVAVTIAMATLAVILCSVIGCIIFIYIKRRYRVKKASSMTPVDTTLHHPTANLPNVEESWELKHSDLAIQGHLGTGQFGDVVLAFLKNTTCTSRVKSHVDRMIAQGNTLTSSKVVAVKFLKDSIASDNMNTFLKEVDLMIKVSATGNNHIVQIVGCILTEQPMAMVMEYVPFGDLHSNLIQWKEQLRRNSDMVHSERNGVDYAYSREALEDSDLLSFGRQISLGMKYLASMKVIHRDLASRNILVGHGKHLKIADFGLSKEIDGLYASSSNTKLPIRWMSPETITHRLFSEKSDVWSFGVCLWEICTLGEVPYGCFSNTEVAKMIASGKCLARPKTCSKEIYDLMVKCWAMECSDRPYFEDVVNYFTTLIENSSANANYIALNEITGGEYIQYACHTIIFHVGWSNSVWKFFL
jgi:serine/threonine protein kinase